MAGRAPYMTVPSFTLADGEEKEFHFSYDYLFLREGEGLTISYPGSPAADFPKGTKITAETVTEFERHPDSGLFVPVIRKRTLKGCTIRNDSGISTTVKLVYGFGDVDHLALLVANDSVLSVNDQAWRPSTIQATEKVTNTGADQVIVASPGAGKRLVLRWLMVGASSSSPTSWQISLGGEWDGSSYTKDYLREYVASSEGRFWNWGTNGIPFAEDRAFALRLIHVGGGAMYITAGYNQEDV